MRRAKRIVLVALIFVPLTVVIYFDARSRFTQDIFFAQIAKEAAIGGHRGVLLRSVNGVIGFEYQDWSRTDVERSLHVDPVAESGAYYWADYPGSLDFYDDASNFTAGIPLGAKAYYQSVQADSFGPDDPPPDHSERTYAAWMPYWMLVGLIAVPSMALLRIFYKRFRVADRLANSECPACGYDCRASPERCPECGYKTRIKYDPSPGSAAL